MTTEPRALLDSMPLDARASIGRGAAILLGVLFLAGTVLAIATSNESAPVDAALIAVPGALAVAFTAVVAFAPWQQWLGPARQEALLASMVVLPAAIVVLVWLEDEPEDTDALLFLAAISVASALTVRLRHHLVGVLVTVMVVAGLAVQRGAVRDVAFVLAVTVSAAALAGLGGAVLGRTVRTSLAREEEAEAASRALRAVVDGARTATTDDSHGVLQAVVEATEHLQSDMAGIYLLRSDGRLEYGAHFRVPEHLLDEVFEPDVGLAGQALTENRQVLTHDYRQFTAGMAAYQSEGLRAAVGTPIRIDDTPVGVLVAGRYSDGDYDPAAVAAFELLADHAGRALALSRAIDEDRRLLDRLKSLHALQEDFVATISHELRTPLTVIDGLAETLDLRGDRLTPEASAQLLSRLRANTTALRTIVTTLLEAARLDRGLVEVEEEVVDLWDLLERCVARMSPVLEGHEVRLDLDDALVLADGDLLERVVDNLLTNAQRHTPPGTSVTLTSRVDGDACVVTISDDGPGIAARDLAVITERFTRGGELHTRSTRGLGLGLALADQILRLHGTRLVVDSPPGSGARFRFRLRIAS